MVGLDEKADFFGGCAGGAILLVAITFFPQMYSVTESFYDTFPFSLLYFEYKDIIPGWPDDLTNKVFTINSYIFSAIVVVLAVFIMEILYYVGVLRQVRLMPIFGGLAWVFTLGLLVSILLGTEDITSLI